ncbi:MAG: hypothetical protein M0D55_18940 [Elusimicrobiota bacterium]|nr:MAG: hypothetical protein M0D55_18940 [Elusimicrobiota bacterium]
MDQVDERRAAEDEDEKGDRRDPGAVGTLRLAARAQALDEMRREHRGQAAVEGRARHREPVDAERVPAVLEVLRVDARVEHGHRRPGQEDLAVLDAPARARRLEQDEEPQVREDEVPQARGVPAEAHDVPADEERDRRRGRRSREHPA